MSLSRIQLSAPLTIYGPNNTVRPNSHLRRGLLTILALHPGHFISYECIQQALWERPPTSSRSIVRTHLAELRNHLEDAGAAGELAISTARAPRGAGGGGGLRLDANPEAIDILKVERLHAAAASRLPAAPDDAGALCRRAFALAPAQFGLDLPSTPWFERRRVWLEDLLTALRELSCRSNLLTGDTRRGLLDAQKLFDSNETRHRSWSLLATAEYLGGMPDRALERIADSRAYYIGLGLELPTHLTTIQQAVLNNRAPQILNFLKHGITVALSRHYESKLK